MNSSSINTRIQIAVHSLGVLLISLILFVLSFLLNDTIIGSITIGGLTIAEMIRIVFSKKKYLVSIEPGDFNIRLMYLNRLLVCKTVSINTIDLQICDIKETNWWLGNLDFINFSNAEQKVTFDFINQRLKRSVLEKLGPVWQTGYKQDQQG